MADAHAVEKIIEGGCGIVLEPFAEIIFAEAKIVGGRLDGQIFGVMLLDPVNDVDGGFIVFGCFGLSGDLAGEDLEHIELIGKSCTEGAIGVQDAVGQLHDLVEIVIASGEGNERAIVVEQDVFKVDELRKLIQADIKGSNGVPLLVAACAVEGGVKVAKW